MEPAFCAVKISCSEMNKMVFRLAFWGSTSPTLYTHFTWLFFLPTSLLYLGYRTCSHVFPLIHLPCSLFYLSFSPRSSSQCAVSGLVYMAGGKERRGEERASLNYTCRQRSAPIQLGPTRCLPSRFTAFVSVASLYMYLLYLWLFYCLCVLCAVLFNHFIMFTVLTVQGPRLCLHCNQQECS